MALENDKYSNFKYKGLIPPIVLAMFFLFVVTWNSITLHQRGEKTLTFAAISSRICSLPAANSNLSVSLNQTKAS